MKLKAVSGITLTLLFIGILTLVFNIQLVKAGGTVYIRADGSVDPDTAPISSVDNITYTFTDNIYDGIVVERDNIVVDGAGYTLQTTGYGIDLTGRSNVTIKNTEIKSCSIWLNGSLNNIISGNNITNSWNGILLYYSSNYNTISGNNIADNDNRGITFYGASSYNTVSGNNITDNYYGIALYSSPNNIIYHNNFIDNAIQASGSSNWHHPVLLEGNYWSDYTGVDDGSGTGKHAIAGDGIGDTDIPWPPFFFDFYPFIKESGWVRTVETTDETGERKDVFDVPETVYIIGSGGYSPLTIYDLYIVEDVKWSGGMDIPDRVSGTETSVTTDENGNIPASTVAWNGPLTPGKYDIVIDVNGNEKYDEDIDALDDEDIEVTAGFFVIPEYLIGTILGLIGCFAAFAVFGLSKRKRWHP